MYMNYDIDFWFDKYDFDKNGLIERDEWEDKISELRDKHHDDFAHVQARLRAWENIYWFSHTVETSEKRKFTWCDEDNDDALSYEEFIIFQFPRKSNKHQYIWIDETWAFFDLNSSGFLNIKTDL